MCSSPTEPKKFVYDIRYGVVAVNGGELHNTLMLDFDRPRAPKMRPFFAVAHVIGIKIRDIQYERTRRGWHITIVCNRKFDPAVRVALQSIMGSDNRREALNLMRVLYLIDNPTNSFWRKRWNLFYERKLSR